MAIWLHLYLGGGCVPTPLWSLLPPGSRKSFPGRHRQGRRQGKACLGRGGTSPATILWGLSSPETGILPQATQPDDMGSLGACCVPALLIWGNQGPKWRRFLLEVMWDVPGFKPGSARALGLDHQPVDASEACPEGIL